MSVHHEYVMCSLVPCQAPLSVGQWKGLFHCALHSLNHQDILQRVIAQSGCAIARKKIATLRLIKLLYLCKFLPLLFLSLE